MKPLILLPALIFGATLSAQTPPPPPPDGNRPPPPPVINVLDTNHDGALSADEIAAAANSLKQLDLNQDGQLSHEELCPPPPPPPPSNSQSGNGSNDGRKSSPSK